MFDKANIYTASGSIDISVTVVGNTSRILLVDDEPNILDVTMEFLSLDPEFEIVTAPSAIEGIQKLAEMDYDAVVSD